MSEEGLPRLAIVADSSSFGGAHVYLTSLIPHLCEEFEIHLVVSRQISWVFEDLTPYVRSVQHVELAEGSDTATDITAAVAGTKPDITIVNMVHPVLNLTALRSCRGLGRVVAVVHLTDDLSEEEVVDVEAVFSGLSAVITVSEPIRRQVVEVLNFPSSATWKISNGVSAPPGLEPVSIGQGQTVGFLGRLEHQKGLEYLVEATRLLGSEFPNLRVLIAGEGRKLESLRSAAAGLPIEFLGFQTKPFEFLSQLDVFCLPSRDEGLPLVLLECLFLGLPIVATDVGDVRAALGDSALIVPPERPTELASALANILSDRELRLSLSASALSLSVDFSSRRCATDTRMALGSLLD